MNTTREKKEKSYSEKLEEAKRDRDSSLFRAIICGAATAGALLVGKHPEIGNEVIQEAAGMILHFWILAAGLCAVNVVLYFLFRRDVKKLESEEHSEDKENGTARG